MRPLRPLFAFVGALVLALTGLAAAMVLRDPPPAPARQARPRPACTPAQPCLVIVIDDIGRDRAALERLLAIPADLTFAVLPHAEHTAASVARLRRAGREHILHLPLEPHPPLLLRDERVLLRADAPIAPALRRCLAAVPGVAALNTHMGSAFSEDPAALNALFAALAPRRLPVLDSRTSPHSQICAVAAAWSVPCVARDVFLDGGETSAAFELGIAMRLARRNGRAIAIGHPLRATIDALERQLRDGDDAAPRITVTRLSSAFPQRRDGP